MGGEVGRYIYTDRRKRKTYDFGEKKLHHTICEFVDCNNVLDCCNDDVEHVGSID